MPAVGDHQRDLEQHRDKVRDFFSHPASARISDRRETYNNFLTGLITVFGLASFFWK